MSAASPNIKWLWISLLVVAVDHDYLSTHSYYLIYPERTSERPLLRLFQDWLEEQAKAYRLPSGLG